MFKRSFCAWFGLPWPNLLNDIQADLDTTPEIQQTPCEISQSPEKAFEMHFRCFPVAFQMETISNSSNGILAASEMLPSRRPPPPLPQRPRSPGRAPQPFIS